MFFTTDYGPAYIYGMFDANNNWGYTVMFAQQRTNPSLHVLHNDMICYANAKVGNQPNTINFNYNGLEYHLEK